MYGKQGFQQQGAGRQRLHGQIGQRGLAQARAGDRIHHAGHHRVLPAHERHVFPLQGLFTLPGDGQAVLRQLGNMASLVLFARLEHIGMLTVVFNIHTQNIERLHHVITDLGRAFLLFDTGNQGFGFIPAAGVELNQGIPAIVQQGFQPRSFLGAARQHGFQSGVIALQCFLPLVTHLVVNCHTYGTALGKGIQPFLEPAVLHFLTGALQVGYVNPDGFVLTDTVQPANSLFQQVRVGGQIKQNQVMGKLEVAAFTADFRADQRLGALLAVGKIGGGTISLQQAQVLVEGGAANAGPQLQVMLQRHGGISSGADHHHFGWSQAGQFFLQPGHSRIVRQPLFFRHCLFRRQANIAVAAVIVKGRTRQRFRQRLALREALNRCPGVAEQHPASAVPVQQRIDHRLMRIIPGQKLLQFITQPAGKGRFVFRADVVRGFKQPAHHFVDRLVLLFLLPERVQGVEPCGVQQAQTGEMTGHTHLLRCGRQQQQAFAGLRQAFNHLIFRAGLLRRPGQVVGFVYHHQVPTRRQGMVAGLFTFNQKIETAQHQLVCLERVDAVFVTEDVVYQGVYIVFLGLDIVVPALIHNRKTQIKAAQHLHQPLVNQRIRHHNQRPTGPAGVQLIVQDQASLNGFAQPHLIGQ